MLPLNYPVHMFIDFDDDIAARVRTTDPEAVEYGVEQCRLADSCNSTKNNSHVGGCQSVHKRLQGIKVVASYKRIFSKGHQASQIRPKLL